MSLPLTTVLPESHRVVIQIDPDDVLENSLTEAMCIGTDPNVPQPPTTAIYPDRELIESWR